MAKEIKRGQRFYSAAMHKYIWFVKRDVRWARADGEWVKERLYYFEDAFGYIVELPENQVDYLVIK